jgi:acetyl-CoA carboxylase carboxyl transferase subunit beta
MPWFRREKAGIRTETKEKIEAPDGLWVKCPACKKPTHIKELILNSHVCPYCGYHYKIGSENYFSILFDGNTYVELDSNLAPADPLNFVDSIPYKQRIEQTQKKTNLKDAVRSATGKIGNIDTTLACMDFSFIGGSMGSVVGEKIARAADYAIANRQPLIIVSKSGGARMMEGALSLMQMAKTSAHLALLHQAKLPYISVLTDPTTGGVTASYAMLGDFNIAEPNSLIGFAGPRVIRETIGKELPAGFQSAEFLLAHGFIDFIVERKQLKQKIVTLLEMLQPW